jgi:hypothetical protein
MTSADDDAASEIASRALSRRLPFLRKDEVSSDAMRRLACGAAPNG